MTLEITQYIAVVNVAGRYAKVKKYALEEQSLAEMGYAVYQAVRTLVGVEETT
jgi:hypothetical protein